jgi:substrate-binding family protein
LWDRDRRLVARARAARVDALFLAGYPDTGGDDLVVSLRRRLHPAPRLLLSDGFNGSANVARLGPTAEGAMISFGGPPLDRLGPAGARFARRLAHAIGAPPLPYSVNAGEATNLLLDAIARSDGTRASVTRQLLAARVHHGMLGDFTITRQGDTTARAITIYRVTHGRLRTWGIIRPPLSPQRQRDAVGPGARAVERCPVDHHRGHRRTGQVGEAHHPRRSARVDDGVQLPVSGARPGSCRRRPARCASRSRASGCG